jgi:hypothetical protein
MKAADESYLDLGRMIAGHCPPGFRQAKLTARLGAGEAELAIECVLDDGSAAAPPLHKFARDDLQARLTSLREEEGREWKSCTVTLTRGGGFTMDVAD